MNDGAEQARGGAPSAGTEERTPWLRLALSAAISGQAMVFSLGVNDAPPSGIVYWVTHGALAASALAVISLLGGPLWANTLESIRDRELTVEMLFSVSLLGALTASLLGSLTQAGHVFYEVVSIVLVIYTLGRSLRQGSRAAARAALHETRERYDQVWLEEGGALRAASAASVRPGSVVVVPPGQPAGIDGEVIEGVGFVDEASLTGEPLPVVKRPGDRLLAGTHAVDGRFRVRVEAGPGQRVIDGVFAAAEEGRLAPSVFQDQADRLVRWFLPLVLAASALTFAGWCWARDWREGLFNSMAVLLVACPCALGMATPVAVWRALARLAAMGLVCRGDAIDGLSRARVVVFDKTGTLTEEQPAVVDAIADAETAARRRWLRGLVGAAEAGMAHPLARALARWGEPEAKGWRVGEVETLPGRGIRARLTAPDGVVHQAFLGEIEDAGASGQLVEKLRAAARVPSARKIWVAVDGHPVGLVLVAEVPRERLEEAVAALHAIGLQGRVLTGDRAAPETYGGMPVERGLSPERKRERVGELATTCGAVAFVGDGLNDAPAMRDAAVSVAMGSGASLTRSGADAVLTGGDLRVLARAIQLCRRVRAGLATNLRFAAAYNLIGVALAAAGLLHPVAAALLMLASSASVAWRAVRSTEDKAEPPPPGFAPVA